MARKNSEKATLKVDESDRYKVIFDLSCPVSSEYEVSIDTYEYLRSQDTDYLYSSEQSITMKCSQGMMHFHATLLQDEGLSINVRDAKQIYETTVTYATESSGRNIEVSSNVEVEHIRSEEDEEDEEDD